MGSIMNVAGYTMLGIVVGGQIVVTAGNYIRGPGWVNPHAHQIVHEPTAEDARRMTQNAQGQSESARMMYQLLPTLGLTAGAIIGGTAGLIYGIATEVLRATNTHIRFTW